MLISLKRTFHNNTAFRYAVLYSSPVWWNISTLNYGYAPVSQDVLDSAIGRNQFFQIELYRQVFQAIGTPLAPGQCLCEISCGRGGGLAYIAGRTQARCIGLEKSSPARIYARTRFRLDVRKAVAPDLGFGRATVDVLISVEAFHNYANDHFLQEVARCLKPGGVIVIADRRPGSPEENQVFQTSLFGRNGFAITAFRDITPNVLEALRGDHDRKARLLRKVAGTFIHDELNEMFANVDSNRYKAFESRAWSYFLFTAMKKQDGGRLTTDGNRKT